VNFFVVVASPSGGAGSFPPLQRVELVLEEVNLGLVGVEAVFVGEAHQQEHTKSIGLRQTKSEDERICKRTPHSDLLQDGVRLTLTDYRADDNHDPLHCARLTAKHKRNQGQ